jgi:hypothetical protein
MNRRRRPWKLRLRASSKKSFAYRSSRKFPFKIVLGGVVLALVIVGALGFAAMNLLKNVHLKHPGRTQVASPSATSTPVFVGRENPIPLSSTPVPAPSVAAKSTPSPSFTPIPRPTVVLAEGSPRQVKSPSEVARKNAEQGRREAERKRARLEALYKSHQISDEAYAKGQEEYQVQMAKYRGVLTGGHSPTPSQ